MTIKITDKTPNTVTFDFVQYRDDVCGGATIIRGWR